MSVLVGKPAPEFKTDAVVNGDFAQVALSDYKNKNYVVLFFYPLDFTFVCPTELHAFQEKLADFNKRDTQVIGCSIDSKFTHSAWLNTPKSQGGIEGVKYALLSDLQGKIASAYGILADSGVAYRALFLIDKQGIVRHQVVNDLPLGRNVEEALRLLDALQHFEAHGEVCPANWSKGKDAMKPTKAGVTMYLTKK